MDAWLASIGLSNRIAAFQAHGIQREQLAELTDNDLRELGLTIGERKRFLRAVLADGGALDLRTHMPADRRPLSMMFVDLVGSTLLAEQMAPEDLMDLLRRYGEFCAGPIGRYGGRITRMVGDGILAYFCFPVANENDPERAVRAALEITRGVGAIEAPGPEPLRVRIGIATGPVVVGDLHIAGGTYRHAVIGPAPNLAARFQALVPPGGIAIGESTYGRVRDRFVCAEMGSFELRGSRQPHTIWQVLREAAAHGRLPRARAGKLIGRAQEAAAIGAAWARARAGEGVALLLAGEPGIGKSRLVQAFVQEMGAGGAEAGTILLEGSAFDADSPLRPVSAWLQRLAVSVDGKATAGDAGLGTQLAGWAECAPALSGLLGNGTGTAEGATPEQRREATLAALTRLLLAQAEARPLRLVMEDLHWFDPTTLELAARLAASLAGRRVLMLMTVRSEFAWEPGVPDGITRLVLGRLDEAEATELARSMLPGRDASAALLRAVQAKAGGVPLFVEEVVRAAMARGGAAAEDVPELSIPASVHEMLAGRLDRLGEAKEIAQAASVIGRDVPRAVLARVCAAHFGTPPVVLDEALELLVGAGVLSEGENGQRAAAFTHALLRDAAYASLLRAPRQALHRQVAAALLEQDGPAAARPELVALHLTEGGEHEASLPHWLRAAELALSRSALTEATRLLRRGIAALDALPGTPERTGLRLDFVNLLGPPLMAQKGYGSAEAMQHYSDAMVLTEQVPESPRNFPIYFGWWRVSRDYDHKLERAHRLLSRARARSDPELQLQAHHCAWASEFFVGDYAKCCEHVEAGLAIYDQHDYRHHMHLYGGHDAKVCGHGEMALAQWMMGRPLSAAAHDRLALDWARRLNHAGTTLHCSESRLYRHAWQHNLDSAAGEAELLMRMADEHAMQDVRAKGMIFLGWAAARRGGLAEGRKLLEEGWARQRDIGTNEDFPVYVSLLAEILIAAGEPERAAEELRTADAEFSRSGLSFWRPEVRRMQGEAALAADPHGGAAAADAAFREAAAVAAEQGASMLALRAATSLAGLDPQAAALDELQRRLEALPEDDAGVDIAAARTLLHRHRRRRNGPLATAGQA